MTASPAWLDALVDPQSIVLVGASDDPTRISGRAIAYLRRYGYEGAILPVNVRAGTVQGLPAFRCLDDLPVDPELAVISVQAHQVKAALSDCAAAGVKTAIVYASGFAEQSAPGAQSQEALVDVLKSSEMRVLGPNCLGSISLANSVTTSFTSALDDGSLEPGSVALLTQSGAFASFVYGAGRQNGVNFGFLANTGNEMDLTVSELIKGVVELPSIGSFLVHVEGLRDIDTFVSAAERARDLGKPMAVVKVGASAVGAAAALAHTNSVVGNDAEYDELFRELGVHRVSSMQELVDAGQAFQSDRTSRGRRATIVTISGGTGVLMADVCHAEGLEVPELSPAVRASMAAVLPAFASTRNPVDVTGAVLDDPTTFDTVLRECLADSQTDVLLVAIGNAVSGEETLTEAIISAASRSMKPIFVTWVGGSGAPAQRLARANIPTFSDPNRAVKAASLVVASTLP